MKKFYSAILMVGVVFMMMVTALTSCNKQLETVPNELGEEIVLGMEGDFTVAVDTRATAINNVSGLPSTLYWGATTGTGTETRKWAVASATRSNANIATGKYQTATPTAYNYYVATQTITIPTSGAATMTVANNNDDVLAGRTAGSTSTNPTVQLNHVFARTGSLTLNTQSGYTLSNVSWTIKGRNSNGIQGTAGTYNLTSGQWTAASTRMNNATSFTSNSDLYLIPGEYEIGVSYTLSIGTDYSQQFSRTAYITLVQGKINNISGTATGGNASEITLTVTVQQWENNNITMTWN